MLRPLIARTISKIGRRFLHWWREQSENVSVRNVFLAGSFPETMGRVSRTSLLDAFHSPANGTFVAGNAFEFLRQTFPKSINMLRMLSGLSLRGGGDVPAARAREQHDQVERQVQFFMCKHPCARREHQRNVIPVVYATLHQRGNPPAVCELPLTGRLHGSPLANAHPATSASIQWTFFHI